MPSTFESSTRPTPVPPITMPVVGRAGVAGAALQPGALAGADRQGQRAHEHLAVAGLGASVVVSS